MCWVGNPVVLLLRYTALLREGGYPRCTFYQAFYGLACCTPSEFLLFRLLFAVCIFRVGLAGQGLRQLNIINAVCDPVCDLASQFEPSEELLQCDRA